MKEYKKFKLRIKQIILTFIIHNNKLFGKPFQTNMASHFIICFKFDMSFDNYQFLFDMAT